ncbi:CS1 type fimbrial major subunit [Burkholderia ambifaria]|nr:CS1 type fimbrial major subunit [Burkholderia ambifaria]
MLAIGAVTMTMAGLAHADTTSQTINIRADVPSGSSYIQPLDGWNAHTNVKFNYDVFSKKLQAPQPIALQMQNDQGGGKGGVINASLAEPAVLSDGTSGDDIPVAVTISSKSVPTAVTLTTTPQPIYNDAAGAVNNGSLAMSADASKTPNLGTHYEGTVDLVFDFQPATSS